jgi:dUTP pyrophosphatase
MIYLNVYCLNDDIELPTYGTSLANCFDLSFQPTSDEKIVKGYNKFNESVARHLNDLNEFTIFPGDRLLVPTGLIFRVDHNIKIETYADIARKELPLQNYSIRLHPRSGLSLKKGLILANSEGIVDVDYQEEVFVLLTNISEVSTTIRKGDRIAQAEVVCNEPFEFTVVKDRPVKHSERNSGFGSTGVNKE